MEFRALGPLEVVGNGAVIDLGPPRQRALLALLLVHANQVVATDSILDQLWGDDADGKENALWVAVSRLRTALEPGRTGRGDSTVVLKRGSGYLLSVGAESFDVDRFEILAGEGRRLLATDPARACQLLGDALRLWRGPAYDDVRYEEFAQPEIARLDEARVSTLEDRLDADLACGRDGELISELEAIHQQHPLRERPVAQLMLAQYRSGRPAEALRSFERFRRILATETGLDPSPSLRRLEEQVLVHDERLRRPTPDETAKEPASGVVNPFKGLRAFGQDDAERFFGRDRLVADLVRAIRSDQRLVTVVGASGAGKSSVVNAGLLPALRKDALAGSSRWLVAQMVPGSYPFVELEAALLRSTIEAPPSLAEQLDDQNAGLLRAVLRLLPDADCRMVLVIDQFEELFALVDEGVRNRFLDNLVLAVDDPHGRLIVVATLRVDFYSSALTHAALGARLSGGVVNVTSLMFEELEEAARQPAASVGVSFEPSLLAQVIADVGRDPGALPMFQFTLAELFDRRVGDRLLTSTYRSMGGVAGALTRRTADLFAELSVDEQRAAEQLFLRLVAVTETGERARRRVSAGELLSLGVDSVATQAVIAAFGRHRLLTFDADRLTGAPTVEVAHEALLTSWDQLSIWIDENRDDLRHHRSFALALREWELSGQDDGYLLTGTRFAEYEHWTSTSQMCLTASESAFLVRSKGLADAQQRSETERRDHERALDRRARRRLWGFGAAAAAFAVLAAVLVIVPLTRDDPPRIGLFTATSGSFGANINAGVERAIREFGFDLEAVTVLINVRSQFAELAQSGQDYIVTEASPIFGDEEVFSRFPDVRFGVIDSPVNAPNAAAILFANEEGSYLMGVAAALKSKTGIVGFVGATPTSDLEEFRAGFEAGAASVRPDVKVLATYVEEPLYGDFTYLLNAFFREDLAAVRASALYERGADVVFHATGQAGFGVFRSAVDQSIKQGTHLWSIGVDNDQWFELGDDPQARAHLLTSMIKRADVASYTLIKQYLDGDFRAGVQELGLADGALDFSTQGSGMTAAIVSALERARADIVSGRIDVPTLPSGALLDLDPIPNSFAQATASVDLQRLDAYVQWLATGYAADFDAMCLVSGTRHSCAQFMLDHLEEGLIAVPG